MATKKKNVKRAGPRKKVKKSDMNKVKRNKITKRIFYASWVIWFLVMLPMYVPNKCAAFFDFLTNASFTCSTFSMILSLILGSLFMAFLTWLLGLIVTWLYFFHERMTWKNLVDFFKE